MEIRTPDRSKLMSKHVSIADTDVSSYVGYVWSDDDKPSQHIRSEHTVMKPSVYQSAIEDFIVSQQGNGIVNAVAGSGKTSTLVMISKHVTDGAFLAFNRNIADELAKRLPNTVLAKTFHSLTWQPMMREITRRTRQKRMNVQTFKSGDIFTDAYGRDPRLVTVKETVCKIVALCKGDIVLPNQVSQSLVADYVDKFGLDWESDHTMSDIADMVRNVLSTGLDMWSVVDYDDYLYMTIVHNLSMTRFSWVFVDESQDLNAAQREIVRRIMKPNARVLFVGDMNQAIYGFRGADSESMATIQQEFSCTPLPLSISYRCPRSVVALAQQIVPAIEASDTAKDGNVQYPEKWSVQDFNDTDLVMCRNTAPLVTLAYKMIGERIGVQILGREIGTALANLVKKIAGARGTLETLPEKLEAYRTREVSKALAKRQESRVQSINDRIDSIFAIIDGMTEPETQGGIPALLKCIDDLFIKDDKRKPVTTLATIHKAKGLEAPRAIILDYHLMPSKYARQPWQQQQERNLQYVAITRALETLTFISSDQIQD